MSISSRIVRGWARARTVGRRVGHFLDRAGWVIAIAFVVVGFYRLETQNEKIETQSAKIETQGRALHTDEVNNRTAADHTREVQKAGEPTGVCLREAARAALPILTNGAAALEAAAAKAPVTARAQADYFVHLARSVDAPLSAYVRLQLVRYPGVLCPDDEPRRP
jgi:hypothetical protein